MNRMELISGRIDVAAYSFFYWFYEFVLLLLSESHFQGRSRGGQKWLLRRDDASVASPNKLRAFSLFMGQVIINWMIIYCVVVESAFMWSEFCIILCKNTTKIEIKTRVQRPHTKPWSTPLVVVPWTTKIPQTYSEMQESRRLISKSIFVLRGIQSLKMTFWRQQKYRFEKSTEIWVYFTVNTVRDDPRAICLWKNIFAFSNSVKTFAKFT